MAGKEAYPELLSQLKAVLEVCPDRVSAMASAAALLMHGLDHLTWVGFYLPQADGSLRVGPYQGPLACVNLAPGKGVCGAVAAAKRTLVVEDVARFPGHIACDPRTRSEIVVPVLRGDELIAVLDADSDRPAAFDEVDRGHLEAAAALVAERG